MKNHFLQRLRRKTARLAAPHIPLPLYKKLVKRNPVGFFYHAVSDAELPHVKHLYPYKSAAAFEQDLQYLQRNYTLVGYPELLTHPGRGGQLPPGAAFLSFDDGFSECFSVVRPLLKKYHIPCIFFLTTGWIDNQGMYYRGKMSLLIDHLERLTAPKRAAALKILGEAGNSQAPFSNVQAFSAWLLPHQQMDEPLIDQLCRALGIDTAAYLRKHQPFLTPAQIRQMHAEGFVFGAHTRRHPKLAFLQQDEQAAEIVTSCREVAGLTGEEQVPFAFPFSGDGVDREMLAGLRARHPHVGLFFDTKKLRRDQPFVYHRIWADQPVPGIPPAHNLEYWLRDAYTRELVS